MGLECVPYIPGSSRYVKFLPFGRFFLVKRHKFYPIGRSRFMVNVEVKYSMHGAHEYEFGKMGSRVTGPPRVNERLGVHRK